MLVTGHVSSEVRVYKPENPRYPETYSFKVMDDLSGSIEIQSNRPVTLAVREAVTCEVGEVDVREIRTREGLLTGYRLQYPLVGTVTKK
jgi:hypothetical protein